MSGFLWLVPVSLVMGLAGLAAFVWSLRTRQYDDPQGDAARILGDDDKPAVDPEERTTTFTQSTVRGRRNS